MATTEQVPKTYQEAMRVLARWQGESGPADLEIFAFPDPQKQVVRLMHVSKTFPDLGGVRVYRMGRSAEFPFRSEMAQVLPKYRDKIKTKSGERLLPPEWRPGTEQRVWPHD